MTNTFTLDDTILHLGGLGPIPRAANEPAYWARSDRRELQEGHVLSVFRYHATWDYQERHPDGDEVAVVLDGSCEVLVQVDGDEVATHLDPRAGFVIPAGAWHRVAAAEPTTVLFVTPVPARTEHRPAPS
jgi:hypothetical protein